ncbi:MAG: AIR synthase family protein [Candidatus Latescibacterota bacterium]
MPCASFPVGKLPQEVLSRFLSRYPLHDDRVVVGPKIGEDCAVIDFGETCLVVKTDPVTFASDEIGWYAVHINANDVATMGARPRWFLATVLLPEGADEKMADAVFISLNRAAQSLDVSLCGGHTEITHGLDRPIVVGQMMGEVAREDLVLSSGAFPGDAILLTKGMAIEATAMIAREKEGELAKKVSPEVLARCRNYLHDPGISVVAEARVACQVARVHAMHDPTEGGVATGLHELATASGVGMVLFEDQFPISEESRILCEAFGLDPLGVLSSGALLIVVGDGDRDRVQGAIREAGIACTWIGNVTERSFGVQLGDSPLSHFERDETARLFGG